MPETARQKEVGSTARLQARAIHGGKQVATCRPEDIKEMEKDMGRAWANPEEKAKGKRVVCSTCVGVKVNRHTSRGWEACVRRASQIGATRRLEDKAMHIGEMKDGQT